MSKEDNGGPAFPQTQTLDVENQIGFVSGNDVGEGGMTLRDYFAAKALQACLTQGSWVYKNLARESYDIADAMLEARNK